MQFVRHNPRSGFTLLEVVLALGLAVIVIALIGTTVNTTLKLVDSGRTRTERDQLARAILNKIAGDLRATVRVVPFDASSMMPINTSSSSKSGSGGSSGSSGGSGSGGSGSSASSGSSGSGGSSGSSGGSGSSGNGASSTSSSGSSSGSSGSSTDSSGSTATVAPTTIAGMIGDQVSLQIDISRIPRLDEYNGVATNSQGVPTPFSDVRTVMYYIAGSSSTIISNTTPANGTTPAGAETTGLIRSEIDHSIVQYSTDQGTTTDSQGSVPAVAAEVAAVEFAYFDGTEWLTYWDTTSSSGLPQAVKISLVLTPPTHSAKQAQYSSVADAAADDPDNVYSMVVRLPACDPVQAPSQSSSGSGSTNSGSGSNSSGSGSSTSGSSGSSGKSNGM